MQKTPRAMAAFYVSHCWIIAISDNLVEHLKDGFEDSKMSIYFMLHKTLRGAH